jgi:hypothetical protein
MDDFTTTKGTVRQSQAVGVWHCSITRAPDFKRLLMPEPWDRKEGWLAAPIIRLLRKTGYELTIDEGWVFPEHHDVLVKWANDLWDIRKADYEHNNRTNRV